jgi:hypothetical protein
MNRARICAILVAAAIVPLGAAHAANRGTAAEARAMLQKAVAHYKTAGRKQALSDFTAGKAPFKDRDLYVVCIASNQTVAANGAYPAFVGTSADALRDANRKPLGKAFWNAAAKNPEGSVQYPMLNPVTGRVEDKTTFYAKVADDLLCGVGAYNAP